MMHYNELDHLISHDKNICKNMSQWPLTRNITCMMVKSFIQCCQARHRVR